MFDLISVGNAPMTMTMTSREIADLTGKRHDNVMADIRKMLSELGLSSPDFSGEYKDSTGRTLPCFNLPKRETMILVSGYSIPMRARIIDRWQELEGTAPKPVELSRMDILKLAMESEEARIKAEAQLAIAAPKAQFHDAVSEAINCQSVQEIAKVLGTGPNRLFKTLRDEGLLMRDNMPYQQYLDAGYFRVVEKQYNDGRGESYTYTRTLVTGKGLAYIQKRLNGLKAWVSRAN